MKINSNFKDLLRDLNEAGARYLVVGGYAVMIHTEPRYTKDLDVWVDPTATNCQAVFEGLRNFGAPLVGLTPGDFAEADVFYQIGIDPVRIDILTSISGVEFAMAWERRVEVDFDEVRAGVLSSEDLIISKRAAGRDQDLIDVQRLTDSAAKKKS